VVWISLITSKLSCFATVTGPLGFLVCELLIHISYHFFYCFFLPSLFYLIYF
jgi:hypothetical protein